VIGLLFISQNDLIADSGFRKGVIGVAKITNLSVIARRSIEAPASCTSFKSLERRLSKITRAASFGGRMQVSGRAPNKALQPTGLSVKHFAKTKSKMLATEPRG
jgi:hypothetical protein